MKPLGQQVVGIDLDVVVVGDPPGFQPPAQRAVAPGVEQLGAAADRLTADEDLRDGHGPGSLGEHGTDPSPQVLCLVGDRVEIDLAKGEIRSERGTFRFPPLPDAVLGIVSARINATLLMPGGAYTVWYVIFNNPEMCLGGMCGLDDILLPDGTPNVPQIEAAGIAADGFGADLGFPARRPTLPVTPAVGELAASADRLFQLHPQRPASGLIS